MNAPTNEADIPEVVEKFVDELGAAMPLIQRVVSLLKTQDDDDDDDDYYRPPPADQVFWEHVFEHLISHGADPQLAGDKADEARHEWLKRFGPPPTLADVREPLHPVQPPADTH